MQMLISGCTCVRWCYMMGKCSLLILIAPLTNLETVDFYTWPCVPIQGRVYWEVHEQSYRVYFITLICGGIVTLLIFNHLPNSGMSYSQGYNSGDNSDPMGLYLNCILSLH